MIWGQCSRAIFPIMNNHEWFPSVCHLLLALAYTCAIDFNWVLQSRSVTAWSSCVQMCIDDAILQPGETAAHSSTLLPFTGKNKKAKWQHAIIKTALLLHLFRLITCYDLAPITAFFQRKVRISSWITMENLNEGVSSQPFSQSLFKLCPEVGGLVPVLC